jgi:glucose/arabinose dehydrogenase
LVTPYGEVVIKGVETGLIFRPQAYSAALFPSEHDRPMLDRIELPPGFEIEIYADGIKNARSLAMSRAGVLFVGTRSEGKVYALVDRDGDYRADEVFVIAQDLNMPNGVAVKGEALYVAEVSRILRFDGINGRLANPPEPAVVYDGFPDDRYHGWKFIAFGPDGRLYVPVGAPCNVCDRGDPYASITRMNEDGSDFEIFARGVRNTVGFDWHPVTGEMWFTDNGRDWLGDNKPPDELNRAPDAGLHFGFPFCHGDGIRDPEFGDKPCSLYAAPEVELGPHVAALGMRFYTGVMFPEEYKNSIFIAEHGSWNRTVPIGYRITTVTLEDSGTATYRVFAQGWLQDGDAWGRPVDLLVLPDGSLLVSDDKGGAIYRISYQKNR